MRVVAGSATLGAPPERAVLTIGNFDGLHLGHRSIVHTVIERARALGGESVVYTFDPHPRKILQPDRAPRLLMTLEQKVEQLAEMGIELLVIEPFTREFAATPPESFLRDVVWERLRPREVYVGYDFHFGKGREGSMRLLEEMERELGFRATLMPEVTIGERDVNSTRIRSLLAEGRVDEARVLLGRPYPVRGRVVAGERRGRTLGFPTVNLAPDNEILPGVGVYAGRVRLLDEGTPPAGSRFSAVTNVGVRPTFEASGGLVAEAHLLEFDGDLYGRRVEIAFEARLRDERRFSGPEALREQIARDVIEARRQLGGP